MKEHFESPQELDAFVRRLFRYIDRPLVYLFPMRSIPGNAKSLMCKIEDFKSLHISMGDEYNEDISNIWPIDTGFCTFISKVNPVNEQPLLVAWKFKSIHPKDVRGRVSRVSERMLSGHLFQMWDNNKYIIAPIVTCLVNGTWVDVLKIKGHNDYTDLSNAATAKRINKIIDNAVKIVTLFQAKQNITWSVSIGVEGMPSFRIQTNPTGIRALFKERDKPENKNRRDALRNWVSQHWRANKINKDDEIFVRKHLRGATKFVWNGYECTVHVPPPVIQENEDLANQRKLMK